MRSSAAPARITRARFRIACLAAIVVFAGLAAGQPLRAGSLLPDGTPPLGGPVAAGPVIERVLAVVSGTLITLTDVHAAIALGLVDPAGAKDPIAAGLDRLIDRALMLAEVERYAPPEPEPEALDARVREFEARLASAQPLEKALETYGLTPQTLRAMARDDLRLAAYIEQRFAPSIAASDDEVMLYYRDHQQEFTRDGIPRPLAEVEPEVRRRLDAERRAKLIEEWTLGLRLRADILVTYLAGTPGGS